MASFPRTITPSQVSRLQTGGVLQSWGDSGMVHVRDTKTGGFWWTETFTNLLRGDADAENLMTFIETRHNRGTSFTVKHQSTPGSGLAPNGSGSSGIQVVGGNQTENSLRTDGWPTNTSKVVQRGDVVKIGSQQVVRIKQDADSDSNGEAILQFYPELIAAPSDNTSITTTDVEFDARIASIGEAGLTTIHYDNIQVTFQEAI